MAATPRHVIAVYQGSFDPITYGHLDIIRRGAAIFTELIVGIGINPHKEPFFEPQERLELMQPEIAAFPNVRAATYDGLTIDFVRRVGADVLLRGIRDMADLGNELQLANLNRLVGGVETVFILASDQHMLTSSSYIRQIFELGGGDIERIRQLVPPNVARRLAERLRGQRNDPEGQ